MRGWSDVFAQTIDTNGVLLTSLYFLGLLVCCLLLLSNLFPAIYFTALKITRGESMKKSWLKKYPGFKQGIIVSDFQLIIWAIKSGVAFEEEGFSEDLEGSTSNLSFKNRDRNHYHHHHHHHHHHPQMDKVVEDTENDINVKRKYPSFIVCRILREYIFTEKNLFIIIFYLFIITDILLMAFSDLNISRAYRQALDSYGIFMSIIFLLEAFLKIISFGPIYYFSNTLNIIDLAITIVSTMSASLYIPNYWSWVRVLRIFNVCQGYVNYFSQPNVRMKTTRVLTIQKLLRIFYLILPSIRYFIISLLCFNVIFALHAMIIFPPTDQYLPDPFEAPYQLEFEFSTIIKRYSFLKYMDAFVTLFIIFTLDGWHLSLWHQMDYVSKYIPIYYFIWIFLTHWILQGLLLASVLVVVDNEANRLLIESSHNYELVLHNLIRLVNKSLVKHYFKLFRRYTLERDIGNNVANRWGNNNHHQLNEVREAPPPAPKSHWTKDFIRQRLKYPLFIIAPSSKLHLFSKKILRNTTFRSFLKLAIGYSVIFSIAEKSAKVSFSYVLLADSVVLSIFMIEMLLKWVAYGLFLASNTERKGYFLTRGNWIDMICNVLVLAGLITRRISLCSFRVLRFYRFPAFVLFMTNSVTVRTLVKAITKSGYSLVSLLLLSFGVVLLCAVICKQLLIGSMGYCLDPTYPPYRFRYEQDDKFPHGCEYVTMNLNDSSHLNTTLLQNEWIIPIDNFDNLWNSLNTVFRILTSNRWSNIFFLSTDVTGINMMPKMNHARQYFLLYLILVVIGITLHMLFVATLYYHFMITELWGNRDVVRNSRDAIWILYEVRMRIFIYILNYIYINK